MLHDIWVLSFFFSFFLLEGKKRYYFFVFKTHKFSLLGVFFFYFMLRKRDKWLWKVAPVWRQCHLERIWLWVVIQGTVYRLSKQKSGLYTFQHTDIRSSGKFFLTLMSGWHIYCVGENTKSWTYKFTFQYYGLFMIIL